MAIINGRSFKYPQLNDKDWLYDKYITKGLSTIEIAQILKCKTANSVRQALLRHSIAVRNLSDSLTHNLQDGFAFNEFTVQVIEGGLLGDASLQSQNPKSLDARPKYKRKNKYYDHVLWEASLLCGESGQNRIKPEYSLCNGVQCTSFVFKTFVHKELDNLFRKWYPAVNDYHKTVPSDFALTRVSLLHWFLDDGCLIIRKRKTLQGFVIMCSESFSKSDNLFLCQQLNKLNIGCSITPVNFGSGWRIRIRQSQMAKFYELIGPCPVGSLSYKWRLK